MIPNPCPCDPQLGRYGNLMAENLHISAVVHYVAHGTGSQCDLCDLERSPHFLFHWSMVTSDVHIDHAKFEDHTFIGNKEK